MNILSTQYTLNQKAYEIYLAGCNANPHCINCHNPESWDFNNGTPWKNKIDGILLKINNENNLHMINKIWILGGEPLDQNFWELSILLQMLRLFTTKEIWLFTRYNLDEIDEYTLSQCDYIKCGRYLPKLTCDNNIQYGVKIATSNQKIYKKGLDYA